MLKSVASTTEHQEIGKKAISKITSYEEVMEVLKSCRPLPKHWHKWQRKEFCDYLCQFHESIARKQRKRSKRVDSRLNELKDIEWSKEFLNFLRCIVPGFERYCDKEKHDHHTIKIEYDDNKDAFEKQHGFNVLLKMQQFERRQIIKSHLSGHIEAFRKKLESRPDPEAMQKKRSILEKAIPVKQLGFDDNDNDTKALKQHRSDCNTLAVHDSLSTALMDSCHQFIFDEALHSSGDHDEAEEDDDDDDDAKEVNLPNTTMELELTRTRSIFASKDLAEVQKEFLEKQRHLKDDKFKEKFKDYMHAFGRNIFRTLMYDPSEPFSAEHMDRVFQFLPFIKKGVDELLAFIEQKQLYPLQFDVYYPQNTEEFKSSLTPDLRNKFKPTNTESISCLIGDAIQKIEHSFQRLVMLLLLDSEQNHEMYIMALPTQIESKHYYNESELEWHQISKMLQIFKNYSPTMYNTVIHSFHFRNEHNHALYHLYHNETEKEWFGMRFLKKNIAKWRNLIQEETKTAFILHYSDPIDSEFEKYSILLNPNDNYNDDRKQPSDEISNDFMTEQETNEEKKSDPDVEYNCSAYKLVDGKRRGHIDDKMTMHLIDGVDGDSFVYNTSTDTDTENEKNYKRRRLFSYLNRTYLMQGYDGEIKHILFETECNGFDSNEILLWNTELKQKGSKECLFAVYVRNDPKKDFDWKMKDCYTRQQLLAKGIASKHFPQGSRSIHKDEWERHLEQVSFLYEKALEDADWKHVHHENGTKKKKKNGDENGNGRKMRRASVKELQRAIETHLKLIKLNQRRRKLTPMLVLRFREKSKILQEYHVEALMPFKIIDYESNEVFGISFKCTKNEKVRVSAIYWDKEDMANRATLYGEFSHPWFQYNRSDHIHNEEIAAHQDQNNYNSPHRQHTQQPQQQQQQQLHPMSSVQPLFPPFYLPMSNIVPQQILPHSINNNTLQCQQLRQPQINASMILQQIQQTQPTLSQLQQSQLAPANMANMANMTNVSSLNAIPTLQTNQFLVTYSSSKNI